MSNIAFTEYHLSDKKENLQLLESILCDGIEMSEILEHFGIDTNDLTLCGELADCYQIDDENLMLQFHTTWDWQEDFYQQLRKHFPTMEVSFSCIEEGGKLFVTNNFGVFPHRYFLDSNFGVSEYYTSFEDVKNRLKSDTMLRDVAKTLGDVNSEQELATALAEWNKTNHKQVHLYLFEEV